MVSTSKEGVEKAQVAGATFSNETREESLDIQLFSSEMLGLTVFLDLKYRIQKKNIN
jgi:hypothetical protein